MPPDDARRRRPTPYMEGLRFRPDGAGADPDESALSDEDLRRAGAEGQAATSH